MQRVLSHGIQARRNKRIFAAVRLQKRVTQPVNKAMAAPDPLVRATPTKIKRAASVIRYVVIALLIHLAPLALLLVDRENDHSYGLPKKQSKVVVQVPGPKPVQKATESEDSMPEPSIVETKDAPPLQPRTRPQRKKRVPKQKPVETEVLPPDWVDMAEPAPSPDATKRRKVVGLSFESTVTGAGPSFAVGNTRMGRTDSRAVDPGSVDKLGRATKKALPTTRGLNANQRASFIPGSGASFEKPQRLRTVKLEYPSTLKARGIEGNVVVMIRIDPAGKVRSVRILRSSGFEELDSAAKKAAANEMFSPAKKNGEPVDYTLKYTYRFRIKMS